MALSLHRLWAELLAKGDADHPPVYPHRGAAPRLPTPREDLSQKSGLNKHQRVHGVDVTPHCAQCRRDIGKTQGVSIHQASYRCPECSIDLSLRIHLQDMIHRYSDSRRGFGKEPKPIRSLERHAAERPFTGTECGNSLKQSNHMLSHQQPHALGKPPAAPCPRRATGSPTPSASHRQPHALGEPPHMQPVWKELQPMDTSDSARENSHSRESD
ncbi:unnamed protein product [Caretta caretta]